MILCITLVICAVMMFGIGIYQLRSKTPVGFYSGEEPPKEENLTDVKAWNRKHGFMWIMYGVFITIGIISGFIIGDSPVLILVFCGSLLVPILMMVLYHRKLEREYLISKR